MALAKEHGLTEAHFAAIRATGISDAGKAAKLQAKNTPEVKRLAKQAKRILRGYFREFTYGRRQ